MRAAFGTDVGQVPCGARVVLQRLGVAAEERAFGVEGTSGVDIVVILPLDVFGLLLFPLFPQVHTRGESVDEDMGEGCNDEGFL